MPLSQLGLLSFPTLSELEQPGRFAFAGKLCSTRIEYGVAAPGVAAPEKLPGNQQSGQTHVMLTDGREQSQKLSLKQAEETKSMGS